MHKGHKKKYDNNMEHQENTIIIIKCKKKKKIKKIKGKEQ